jgi:hypothetical protein
MSKQLIWIIGSLVVIAAGLGLVWVDVTNEWLKTMVLAPIAMPVPTADDVTYPDAPIAIAPKFPTTLPDNQIAVPGPAPVQPTDVPGDTQPPPPPVYNPPASVTPPPGTGQPPGTTAPPSNIYLPLPPGAQLPGDGDGDHWWWPPDWFGSPPDSNEPPSNIYLPAPPEDGDPWWWPPGWFDDPSDPSEPPTPSNIYVPFPPDFGPTFVPQPPGGTQPPIGVQPPGNQPPGNQPQPPIGGQPPPGNQPPGQPPAPPAKFFSVLAWWDTVPFRSQWTVASNGPAAGRPFCTKDAICPDKTRVTNPDGSVRVGCVSSAPLINPPFYSPESAPYFLAYGHRFAYTNPQGYDDYLRCKADTQQAIHTYMENVYRPYWELVLCQRHGGVYHNGCQGLSRVYAWYYHLNRWQFYGFYRYLWNRMLAGI